MPDQPNILWICSDSQRWDTLGCYGNPWVRTPHLDALAGQGVVFEHAFAQNPLCQPSRGSFLTGRYPRTTRLRQNGQNIPDDERLITRQLADAGYVCGLVGKLHLSACDRRCVMGDWHGLDPERFMHGIEHRIDDGYAVFEWDHAPTGWNRASAYTQWVLGQGGSFERPVREDCRWVKRGMPEPLHQTTWCFDRAEAFVRTMAGSVYPWCLSVNAFDPHFDFDPPEPYLQRYLERLDEIPLPNYQPGELDNKPQAHRRRAFRREFGVEHMTARDHRMARAAYWAMCDLLDRHVGRVLAALDETGQAENTIVIYMSDHGEMLGDHGIYKKGALLYEPALRVPLIVRYPRRWGGGRRITDLVELADLAPTLTEAAGLPRAPGMQARSLVPLLAGQEGAGGRDDVYAEYYRSNPTVDPEYCTMLRTPTMKLIRQHAEPVSELYDLEADPGETRNVWAEPAYAAARAELTERLCDRMAYTCDPLPQRIGLY